MKIPKVVLDNKWAILGGITLLVAGAIYYKKKSAGDKSYAAFSGPDCVSMKREIEMLKKKFVMMGGKLLPSGYPMMPPIARGKPVDPKTKVGMDLSALLDMYTQKACDRTMTGGGGTLPTPPEKPKVPPTGGGVVPPPKSTTPTVPEGGH